jgi:hypothetical protein
MATRTPHKQVDGVFPEEIIALGWHNILVHTILIEYQLGAIATPHEALVKMVRVLAHVCDEYNKEAMGPLPVARTRKKRDVNQNQT